jgi:hypothetical protein
VLHRPVELATLVGKLTTIGVTGVLLLVSFGIWGGIGGGKAVDDFCGEGARFHFGWIVWIGGGPHAGCETFYYQGGCFQNVVANDEAAFAEFGYG